MNEEKSTDPATQEGIKNIISRLHRGEGVQKVKKDFDRLIKDVSPEEIAAMEQALMKEGLPAEEIQRLCEVHVAVFETTLGKQGRPEKMPGHPVHTFMAENDAARASLKRLKRILLRGRFPWVRKDTLIADFDRAIKDFKNILIHYTRKENQLFPFLEAKGFDAPSKVMWGKHDEIRGIFREIDEAVKTGKVDSALKSASALAFKASKMFFMEERILFPTALKKLNEQDWIALRRGESAIGYAWVGPGGAWDPDIAEFKQGSPSQENAAQESAPEGNARPNGPPQTRMEQEPEDRPEPAERAEPADRPDSTEPATIALGVGRLTPSQLDMMLKALPIDISFVDENDRVAYYSDNAERIFPRSPAVIGRDVSNCHPPKSVQVVHRILEAFRKKEKAEASFWIHLGGKFVYIRYFPIYDESGTYKGTIEVTQDATAIRGLEGERRLLDWD